jgi:hypothetical protein
MVDELELVVVGAVGQERLQTDDAATEVRWGDLEEPGSDDTLDPETALVADEPEELHWDDIPDPGTDPVLDGLEIGPVEDDIDQLAGDIPAELH